MSSGASIDATAADASSSPTVLILGGWSPGPLLYLKRNFYRQCIFVEPAIPIPPVGISWCCNGAMLALLGALAFMIWACIALADYIDTRAWLALFRLAIIVVGLFLCRLCVAAVVRGSIKKGVLIASKYIRQENVDVVLGFSWGGGVAAEMIRLGLIGGTSQPSVLLIAPTTSLMASFAMKQDAPLTIRVPNEMSSRVHVFHGTDDETFCPHSNRWEGAGATLHLLHDNHVFCRRESIQELFIVLSTLLQ